MGVEADVAKVRTEVQAGSQEMGTNEDVIPEGRPETENTIPWVFPDVSVVMTVVDADVPWATVMDEGKTPREYLTEKLKNHLSTQIFSRTAKTVAEVGEYIQKSLS
jgi:hypothetical protein